MNKRLLFAGIAVAVAVLAVGAVGCKSSKKTTKPTATVASHTATPASGKTPGATAGVTPSTTTTGASTTPSASTVNVTQDATLGKILTDAAGYTLYKYANDTAGVSNCDATCAQNWPPLTSTGGKPTAGTGATGTLAVITRSDGSQQVTYGGKPLYRHAGDSAPGDTTGNGVANWSVVTVP